MNFPVALYTVALIGAFTTSLAALPLWRKWCLRAGWVDDPGPRKIHEEPVALAGGLTVMTALSVPALLAVLILMVRPSGAPPEATVTGSNSFIWLPGSGTSRLLLYGLNKRGWELGAIFLGAFGMLFVGLVDDRRELRPAAKFAGQLVVAGLVAAAGVRITLFIPSLVFSYTITVLWILAVINAFNFMDNMNGLCAGLGVIGAFYFALVSALAGQYLVALIAFLTCGALLGFLPYNFPGAKAFLGDAGSHLTGYLLAILAILPHFYTRKNPRALAVLGPLLILAVPLGDLVRVVILRWRMGKPFYVGDANHLSHIFVRNGLSRVQAVVLIWVLAAFLGGLAFVWQR